jgi:hypothetical protein
VWTVQHGTAKYDAGHAVVTDHLGNVFVAGETSGSLGGANEGLDDAFVSKFDASGQLLWCRQLGTSGSDRSYGVATDHLGNVFISGWTEGSLDEPNAGGHDAFVSKYDSAGSLQWTRQFGTSGYDTGYGVATDQLGNIVLSGGSYYDAYVRKYDSGGDVLWTRRLGTTDKGEISFDVATDHLGNILITGVTGGNLAGPQSGGDDAFVSMYDPSGNPLWTRQLGTSVADYSYGVATDSLRNIFIAGMTRGDLGGPSTGESDVFVSKYDSHGTLLWTRQMGTSYQETGWGLTVDSLDNVYVAGDSYGSWDDPNAGYTDGFLVKLVPGPATLALLGVGALGLLRRRRSGAGRRPKEGSAVRMAVLAATASLAVVASPLLAGGSYTAMGDLLRTYVAPDGDSFGFGRYIAAYGDKIAVSNYWAQKTYILDANTGAGLHTLTNPWNSGNFGRSLAMIEDKVLVGSDQTYVEGTGKRGAAFLYDARTGDRLHSFWSPDYPSDSRVGYSVAAVTNGLLLGAWEAEAAYLFNAETGQLIRTFRPPLGSYTRFGFQVTSAGTNRALISATSGSDPAVYLFDTVTGQLLQSFPRPSADAASFGDSTAMAGDKVVIGASGEASSGGAAYVYDGLSGDLIRVIHNPSPADSSNFAAEVVAFGDLVAIGCPGIGAGPEHGGRIDIFDVATGDRVHTIRANDHPGLNYFGNRLALFGRVETWRGGDRIGE